MTFKVVQILLLVILSIQTAHSINPYHVLELQEGATEDQIRTQYKNLKKSHKDNKIKQQLYDDAYQQIMIDSTLQMTLPKQEKQNYKPNRRNRRRRGMPRLSDMFRQDYFAHNQARKKSSKQKAIQAEDKANYEEQLVNQHGYRLPPQFDDPSYYDNQQKAQKTLRDQNIAFNIKAAQYILFFVGILLKLTPCICIYLIWKYRQGPREALSEDNPLVKAMNGWTGKNRRTLKKNK